MTIEFRKPDPNKTKDMFKQLEHGLADLNELETETHNQIESYKRDKEKYELMITDDTLGDINPILNNESTLPEVLNYLKDQLAIQESYLEKIKPKKERYLSIINNPENIHCLIIKASTTKQELGNILKAIDNKLDHKPSQEEQQSLATLRENCEAIKDSLSDRNNNISEQDVFIPMQENEIKTIQSLQLSLIKEKYTQIDTLNADPLNNKYNIWIEAINSRNTLLDPFIATITNELFQPPQSINIIGELYRLGNDILATTNLQAHEVKWIKDFTSLIEKKDPEEKKPPIDANKLLENLKNHVESSRSEITIKTSTTSFKFCQFINLICSKLNLKPLFKSTSELENQVNLFKNFKNKLHTDAIPGPSIETKKEDKKKDNYLKPHTP